MPSRSRARGDLLVAVVTLALIVVLYPGAMLRGESFFERDLHLDWYPRLAAIVRGLSAGSWPLWDLSIGFGQPLLADPGAQVLYPATWLVLALPWGAAYTAFVGLHLLAGALGTARVAAVLGAGRTGSVAAAVLWVLSGPVQSSVNLWHHFAGAAWMPWVLLATDRAVRRPGVARALGLAVAASLQVLAGSADACAMTLVLAAGWALVRLGERLRRRQPAGGTVLVLLATALLVAGLTAVQWWPALDVLGRSPRRALAEDLRTAWAVPPEGLWRIVAPLDPARVPFEPETWRHLYDRADHPFLLSIYLGLPALVLASLALATRRGRRHALPLVLALVAAIGFAMGPHASLYGPAASLLPVLRIFRYPSKAMLGAGLVAALLGGLGAGALARRRLTPRGLGLAAATALAAAAVTALACARYRGPAEWPLGSLLAAGVALLLVLSARAGLRPGLASVAAVALAAVDLIGAHADLSATAPVRMILDRPPAAAFVDRTQGRRLYVYDYHSVRGTSERHLGRPDPYRTAVPPPGLDPRVFYLLAQRLYLLPPSAGLFGLEGSYDLDLRGLYPRDLNDLTFFLRRFEGTPFHERLLRMGAVGTVLSLHRRGLEDLRLERTLPSLFPEPIRVWRVPGALPRSWVVGRTRVADAGAAFQALLDPDFDPAREAIVAGGEALDGPPDFAGASRLAWLGVDRLRIDAEASAPALLVLADAYDPGWRATVDGRPAAVVRANVAFRAVPLPPGRHRVEMVYRPRAVTQGLIASSASLLIVLGAAVARARGARRRRER
jgi:hypothetical protein